MILGIDLGSTNSYVTVIPKRLNGKPLEGAVLGSDGNPNIPTIYAYDNGKESFGREAYESKGKIDDIKRSIRQNPNKLDKLINPSIPVTYGDVVRRYIGFLIELTKSSFQVEAQNEEIEYVTITYPTGLPKTGMQSISYSELIRTAVIEATGLEKDHVFAREEPLAAAYSFVYDRRRDKVVKDRKILVFDLGGGTLDLALVNCSSDYQQMEVMLTDGNEIGGTDWTELLARYLEAESGSGYTDKRFWITQAEWMKTVLSIKDEVRLRTPTPNNKMLDVTISRMKFNTLTRDLLEKCISCVDKVLDAKDLTFDDIDYYVLVGGGCYMPQIQDYFKGLPGGERKTVIHKPDQAVSLGAALWTLEEARPPGVELGPSVEEIASHTYGIEVFRSGESDYAEVKNLIFKGDKFSSGRVFISMDKSIRPRRDDQKDIALKIYESNLSREDCDDDGFVQISKRTVPVGGDKIVISIPRGYSKATDFAVCVSMELYSDNSLGITIKDAKNKRVLYNNLEKIESGCSNA